jgi:hypothetical protein
MNRPDQRNDASRRRHDSRAAAPRIDQDAAASHSGGAGPGLGPERAIPRWRGASGSPRDRAASRSAAAGPRNARTPAHQARTPGASGARTGLRLRALRTWGQRRRQGRGLGRDASVRHDSRPPAGACGQQTTADQQVENEDSTSATSRIGTASRGSSRSIARRGRHASGAGTRAGPSRTRCVTDGSHVVLPIGCEESAPPRSARRVCYHRAHVR